MKKPGLLLLCFLIVLTMIVSPVAYGAKPETKVVRVGWYESAFHRTDQFGRRSGYGYEYQQRISTYTGWTYEYVEGSWSELLEKLIAGEIDLLSDVSYTEARAEKILYSAESMGSEDYHAFIAPTNTEIRPDDFSTFNGKRLGVNKNSIQEQLYIEWAERHDVHAEIIELSLKTPELLDMLAKGELDMLVTLDTYGNSADIVPVCKVGSAQSYFGINKDRPDIKRELDTAMNRIFEDNRDFNQQLTEKYNKASSVSSFLTMEETEWLSQHGVIRVGFRDGFLPFCARDELGALTGSLADYLKFAETAEKNARLSFETRAYETTEAALQALTAGEIDCVFPVNLSSYDGEKLGVIVSDPFVTTEMFVATRTTDRQGVSPDRMMTVAALIGHPSHETFLMDHFPGWRIRYYNTVDECFQSVAAGDTDCTLVSNYRLNRVGELLRDYDLAALATGENLDLCFAMNQADDCLYSILNKITRLIPNAKLNSSLTRYSFQDEKLSLLDLLKNNLPHVITIIAIVACAILYLLFKSVRAEANARAGRELISEAEADPLVPELYSRSFFHVYADRHYREHPDKPMDAIILNIDRFHTINTMNGREYGNEVLRLVGQEIAAYLKETDGIGARIEGDHFDIYCAHIENYAALLERFQSKLTTMITNADVRLRMGVMPWQKDVTPREMFDRAWLACSMVRRDYKSHLMIYDEAARQRDEFNQILLSSFTHALESHELEVYYQPKYDIQQDPPKLASCEALVRWQHPTLGIIAPDAFIKLFERSGQITILDKYVWEEAARQISFWRDRYGVLLPVSVNLSRVDVFNPDLPDLLDGIVEKYGLERKDLNLEVTESAYTENSDHLIRVIGQLREKGYVIEMDDFGTGYSSLNMLSSMPIDVLKMDMAFIRNIERNERDFRLVELILDIARYLKVPVVAEGVETDTQLRLLRNAGCDLVQGYYFSRPLPAEEFAEQVLKKA